MSSSSSPSSGNLSDAAATTSKQKLEESPKVNMAAMRKAVKKLHFGQWIEKLAAAEEIKLLAAGSDAKHRKMMGELGVVPTLVDMLLESAMEEEQRRVVAEALVALANGSFTNKVLMVKTELISKLPLVMNPLDFSKNQEMAMLLLSVSSLAKANIPFNCHNIISLLTATLNSSEITQKVMLACLATMQNLSTKLENSRTIVSNGAVSSLLALSVNRTVSEEALATLGNLVLIPEGKKAIEDDANFPESVIEVLAWGDKPRCQELASYILMILAHGSKTQRKKMVEVGIVPLLLEVALLGSPLARKRAMKMLQWLQNERKRMLVYSGPQIEKISISGRSWSSDQCSRECKKSIRTMVLQSFNVSMGLIVRRATTVEDSSCSSRLR